MEIRINGQTADIKADCEKTLGQFLANLEMWLSDSGHSFSGLAINGGKILAQSMEDAFSRDINTINTVDIFTSSLSDLLMESLEKLTADINEWDALYAGKKNNFPDEWRKTPQALLLCEKIPDLYRICERVFSLGDMDALSLHDIVRERAREITEPSVELKAMESMTDDICGRLVDLPLDIQTAKDAHAAQTISIFTVIYEKIIRLYKQLSFQGYLEKTEDGNMTESIKTFNSFLKEFLDAYERHDTILAGDLSEYEIAVRLKELYSNITKNIIKDKVNQ
ncbi:MAG: hypothetical protein LBB81_06645 [Treponema sp.]|jgi:hypothetical protein|nr:hypothetical protein [Treponema sp.]